MKVGACIQCGHEAAGHFCPVCGARQERVESADPAVGRIIADRYEIVSSLKEGGMGRLYVALQRSLKRKVALKLIRPSMTTVARIADRFLVEAQAASHLNHPNVVSIFDFGQHGEGVNTELYIVMELLSGSDLRDLIDSGAAMTPPRIVDIIRQTLAGLAEAHEQGITHRDIKPENIFLTKTRRGTDHVKLIDFGVARVDREESLTMAGQFVGTPWYSAPEQITGETSPHSDLYAIGVVLYELLTGEVPFDDPSPVQILIKHETAARPDPAKAARDVPRALADACMRAMAVDPADRFPSAEAMADALLAAFDSRGARTPEASIFPRRRARSSAPAAPETLEPRAKSPSTAPTDFGKLESVVPPPTVVPLRDAIPLVGRADDVAWVRAILESSTKAILLHGNAGVGRTRLLREIAGGMEQSGYRSIQVASPPEPQNQIGYLGLRDLLTALLGAAPRALVAEEAAPIPAASGCRSIFDEDYQGLDRQSSRANATAALVWATRSAVKRTPGGKVALFIDDVDLFDGASLLALGDAIQQRTCALPVVMTSLTRPAPLPAGHVEVRELRGLGPAEVSQWLTNAEAVVPDARRLKLGRYDRLQPLYLEHALACVDDEQTPASLDELIASRVDALLPAARRALQALAVLGACTLEELAEVLDEDDVETALHLLVDDRMAEIRSGMAQVAHRMIARRAIAMAPTGTISALHAGAARSVGRERRLAELRAYHSVRGRADFEAFMLVEEATSLRTLRGDDHGAVDMLATGLLAAATASQRGEVSAESAETVFARKLGGALVSAGRPREAVQLLEETIGERSLGASDEALVLEQLSIAYAAAGRADRAADRGKAALERAKECDDQSLIRRLSSPATPPSVSTAPPLYWSPSESRPSLQSLTALRVAVVTPPTPAVRRDPRREDD